MKLYLDSEIANEKFSVLPSGIITVSEIAELLTADLKTDKGVVWCGEYTDALLEIVPKERKYGWMLASLKNPFFIKLGQLEDLEKFNKVKCDGFVSSSKELLLKLDNQFNG